MGTTSPANSQIFPLQPHYSAPAQNNRNKNPTTLHLYLLVQWLSFKSNTKPLGFLFAFMASTSTSKPGHLLVLAWDKSLVTWVSDAATFASKGQQQQKISFCFKYISFSVSSTLFIPRSQASVLALAWHTRLFYPSLS